jgi:L-arabinokinase
VLPDTKTFIDTIRSNVSFFNTIEELIYRAPGRLDVMGCRRLFSSLVLQLPIADATRRLQKSDLTRLHVLSLGTDARSIEFDLSEFLKVDNAPVGYDQARQRFATPTYHWASYVAGVFLVLMREKGVHFTQGARILITSNVPEGKGVSSSAALEVAVMQAVAAAFEIELPPTEVARLCQKVENLVAGAPCGIMDQMTAACGEQNQLLELLCQPDLLKGTLALPNELKLWGIDSGVRHSVSGSDYGTVRTAAFMGYRIIADDLPKKSANVSGKIEIDDSRWHGYLANITPAEFETSYRNALPEHMSGAAFLDRYQGITDNVTTVDPNIEYPILQATKHAVYENARVQSFAAILKNWEGIEQGKELGALMFESHQSYSNCGLGSEATDLIAGLVRESLDDGLFGARITGGGSGGTVAVLGRSDATQAIAKLTEDLHERTGHKPLVITGSSPGPVSLDI